MPQDFNKQPTKEALKNDALMAIINGEMLPFFSHLSDWSLHYSEHPLALEKSPNSNMNLLETCVRYDFEAGFIGLAQGMGGPYSLHKLEQSDRARVLMLLTVCTESPWAQKYRNTFLKHYPVVLTHYFSEGQTLQNITVHSLAAAALAVGDREMFEQCLNQYTIPGIQQELVQWQQILSEQPQLFDVFLPHMSYLAVSEKWGGDIARTAGAVIALAEQRCLCENRNSLPSQSGLGRPRI